MPAPPREERITVGGIEVHTIIGGLDRQQAGARMASDHGTAAAARIMIYASSVHDPFRLQYGERV